MRSHRLTRSTLTHVLVAVLASVAALGASPASADSAPDFANPGVGLSRAAVIASGTCIAKYTVQLNDESQPADAIGRRVAKQCAKQISLSAGLASMMTGKPGDFAKNLKYAQEDLTTNAVLRYRAAKDRRQ